MYSLQQKEYPKSLHEKSSVIFSVNIFQILHTSTYKGHSVTKWLARLPAKQRLLGSNPGGSIHSSCLKVSRMRNLNSLKVSGVRKKHLNKVYITKHSTDGASCVSEVLVCKYTKSPADDASLCQEGGFTAYEC